ncbi:hypothetical protein DAPPUDRAFT_269013 [Daphnia pulex]|uniref:Uncharacterized protein n=1 Tax=Daphnia pulex TaxID=6669 RepID=E9HYP0_DAPPU|nr:hypothetical protein DAPPUDRAFT_269013 [Daphnia pulex]|eukprot:EFX63141.1 hypothetical protein DAPPUDRAFT_269013 [Daphnia pulex]
MDPMLTRIGGAYIPPTKLRIMQAQITDKSERLDGSQQAKSSPQRPPYFERGFPRDDPRNTRFAINFLTSIGLGDLT